MSSDLHLDGHFRLASDANHLRTMFGLLPAMRRFISALSVEVLDECIRYGRPNVCKSPRNSLVVANNHIRHPRQRYSSHIEILRLQMRLIPQVRHLMPEMHIVREQRFTSDRVLTRDDPVV